jgi:serine/threonine protein kinase
MAGLRKTAGSVTLSGRGLVDRVPPDDWPVLLRLLDGVLEQPEAQREAWVSALPPADARWAPALRQLLARGSRRAIENFLETLPGLAVTGSRSVEPGTAGAEVGPYRLLRPLGAGGMGTVWLAERADGLIKRPVALKLPRQGSGGALFAERLARERDILAGLSHPDIARLLDAGVTAEGQPFVALEYVEGQPIDRYCETRGLDLRGRLALFVRLARAVAHAHAHLVVHRDLKPSNILVSDAGDLRLLDFGIAKLIPPSGAADRTALTDLGGRVLTPDYAAPEQLRGEAITTATDVYSLGVLLFQLLTGARPYLLRRASAAELEEAILNAPPLRPSAAVASRRLRRQLAGDLDTIVGRALRKPPEERYGSVGALADDIERHLRGEAVLGASGVGPVPRLALRPPARAGHRADRRAGRGAAGGHRVLGPASAAGAPGGRQGDRDQGLSCCGCSARPTTATPPRDHPPDNSGRDAGAGAPAPARGPGRSARGGSWPSSGVMAEIYQAMDQTDSLDRALPARHRSGPPDARAGQRRRGGDAGGHGQQPRLRRALGSPCRQAGGAGRNVCSRRWATAPHLARLRGRPVAEGQAAAGEGPAQAVQARDNPGAGGGAAAAGRDQPGDLGDAPDGAGPRPPGAGRDAPGPAGG